MSSGTRDCSKHANRRFIPYLEKHRIYELFYDIGEALAMTMPYDHVLYIRRLLTDLADIRFKPRIILITPPQIDGLLLAQLIQKDTDMRIITLAELTIEGEDISSQQIAFRFNDIVAEESLAKKGWIIYDFPRTGKEAAYLQKERILPTHTFEICASPDKYSPEDAWCENVKNWRGKDLARAMDEHKRRVFALGEEYKSSYKKVPVGGRSLEDLNEEIRKLARVPSAKGAPNIPRVVLIGTRGSGRRTTAKRLEKIIKTVHVDFEKLILGALSLDNETGDNLRRLKERGVPAFFKTLMAILQDRLLQPDCMDRGWVLTGFPRDLGDLVALDKLDNPPNKIIFLSIDNEKALERLLSRKVNAYNGKVMTIAEIEKDPFEDINEYLTHPNDLMENVLKEQEEFAQNVKDMLDYCGDNCDIMNAEESEDIVAERVSRRILQPWPITAVRTVKEQKSKEAPYSLDGLRYTLLSFGCTSSMLPQLDKTDSQVNKD